MRGLVDTWQINKLNTDVSLVTFLQKVQQGCDCRRNISNLFELIYLAGDGNWKLKSLKPGFTNKYLAAKKISKTYTGNSNLFLTNKSDMRNHFFLL